MQVSLPEVRLIPSTCDVCYWRQDGLKRSCTCERGISHGVHQQVKMDETEQMRREKYSHGKKEPQVRWYVHRLRQLIRAYSLGAEAPFPYGEGPPSAEGGAGEKQGPAECATAPVGGPVKPAEPSAAEEEKDGDSSEDGEGWVVVDIGGGRGDLAINLARLLPRLRVHMMDIHTPSLRDAEKAAAKFGPAVHSRCSFRVQDVTQLFSAPSLLPPHIVHRESNGKIVLVGLHCCGGLTDAILALARRHRVAFLCCPCCFLKHAHLRSLAHDSDFAAPAGCIVCPSSAQPDPSYASDDVRGAASGALAEGGEMEGQASGETKGNSSQRSLHDQGCWEASEWELHWDRLARANALQMPIFIYSYIHVMQCALFCREPGDRPHTRARTKRTTALTCSDQAGTPGGVDAAGWRRFCRHQHAASACYARLGCRTPEPLRPEKVESGAAGFSRALLGPPSCVGRCAQTARQFPDFPQLDRQCR